MRERSLVTGVGASDALIDVLAYVHLHGALFFRAILRSPWGLTVPKRKNATFHFVASGQCWLEVDGHPSAIKLAAGDLAILPHGDTHTLRDKTSTVARGLDELLSGHPVKEDCVLECGGKGRSTTLLCGGFVIENAHANPLIASLPPVLRLPAERLKSLRWLGGALDWIMSEMKTRSPGSEAVTNRLSEILFVEALRAYCAEGEEANSGWVRALADPQIGSALALIHREPEVPWTVAAIAHRLEISRSSFASKFERLVGEPPLQYVTRCRLRKAARLLQTTSVPLPEVARSVGYSSAVAFHKAFKRYYQMGPGEFRRHAGPTRRLKTDWLPTNS